MEALGMIEVYGRVGAIEGLDSALKAANVSLVNMIRVGGGYTTVLIEGDVGAVKAAIDAATVAAEKVGKLVSHHVIPRPDKSVREMVDMTEKSLAAAKPKNTSKNKSAEASIEPKSEMTEKEVKKTEGYPEENADNTKKLESLTVGELRTLARSRENFSMTKEEIKFAKKDELIKALK